MPVSAATGRPVTSVEPLRLRSAVLELVESERLLSWQIAPLLAWLAAFKRHWPSRFKEVLGEIGELAVESLDARLDDRNRYLKLRRIAIANLSGLPDGETTPLVDPPPGT
jgi:hypothetical protein